MTLCAPIERRADERRPLEEPGYTGLGGVMAFDRITIDPKICHGQACVKGTRIAVHQVVRMLANGDSVEDLLAEYPSLSREDIMACLDYAAELAEEQVTPIQVAGH